jgi:hypothetical protein
MGDFELFEKIEAYLKGELSPEEMKNFELNIKNNPSLAEAVELHRLEWDAMEVLIENALREKMIYWNKPFTYDTYSSESQEAEKEETQPVKLRTAHKFNNSQLFYWKWALAASIVLLLVASIWIYYQPKNLSNDTTITQAPPPTNLPNDSAVQPPMSDRNNTPQYNIDTVDNSRITETTSSPKNKKKENIFTEKQIPLPPNAGTDNILYQTIAQEAYEKEDFPSYESLQTTRGDSASDSVLDQAGKAYDKKDFNRTIALLKNTPPIDENFLALEILGHAYFQIKNYQAALPVFQNLLQLSGRKSSEKSEWYLLLCYLANYNKYQKDFNVLAQKIMNNKEHTYFASTTTLVERVRRK